MMLRFSGTSAPDKSERLKGLVRRKREDSTRQKTGVKGLSNSESRE